MMIIKGARAIDCQWGGFFTNDPNTQFIDCVAENCGGFGFLDASGVAAQKPLPNPKKGFAGGIEHLKQIAGESEALRENLIEIRRALDMLNLQVQSDQPDKNIIGLWFQRIRDLSEEHGNEDKAREIFSFGSSIEWHLRTMRAHGIL